MNKALEDLQAGRDPFAAQEEESNGDFFYRMALWSMWLAIMTGVLCKSGTEVLKSLGSDPKTAHMVWLSWLIGSYVLFAASIIMGVVALFGIRKYGAQGILTRALRGVLISGICLSLLITGTIRGIENRKVLAAVQASADEMRSNIKKDLDQNHGVPLTNYSRETQKMRNALDDASQKLSGNDALIARATSSTLGRMQVVLNEYTAAAAPLLQPAFISMNGVVQPQQLQGKKEIVAKFMAANEKVLAFVNNADKVYTEEMNKLQVPAEAQASSLKGFQSGFSAQTGVLPKIREKDRAMGTALMAMFNLLDANWGRWKYNEQSGKVGFEDTAALNKYNALLKDIVTAAHEQTELQKQYFAMQPKSR